jgi:hypothetical protein
MGATSSPQSGLVRRLASKPVAPSANARTGWKTSQPTSLRLAHAFTSFVCYIVLRAANAFTGGHLSMGALPNAKHERFAQARFAGMTMDAAYQAAGYKPHRQNASRLMAKDDIKARVAELQEGAAARKLEVISFDAKAQFEMLTLDIISAREAGNFNAVMKGHETRLRAFGYLDSPTLTHEHVRGQRLDPQPAPAASESKVAEFIAPAPRFAAALLAFKRKLGEEG